MSNTHNCKQCGQSLTGKYGNARHCSHSCRSKTWRATQTPSTSVKLKLTKPQFDILKSQADSLNLLINQFIISKAMNASGCVNQWILLLLTSRVTWSLELLHHLRNQPRHPILYSFRLVSWPSTNITDCWVKLARKACWWMLVNWRKSRIAFLIHWSKQIENAEPYAWYRVSFSSPREARFRAFKYRNFASSQPAFKQSHTWS